LGRRVRGSIPARSTSKSPVLPYSRRHVRTWPPVRRGEQLHAPGGATCASAWRRTGPYLGGVGGRATAQWTTPALSYSTVASRRYCPGQQRGDIETASCRRVVVDPPRRAAGALASTRSEFADGEASEPTWDAGVQAWCRHSTGPSTCTAARESTSSETQSMRLGYLRKMKRRKSNAYRHRPSSSHAYCGQAKPSCASRRAVAINGNLQ
jgi:hypothetical protein